jgi:succinate dehydrogenase hydrophobic anchor subunit
METGVAITGMQRHFTQVVYLGILVGALYHGGYGIWSLAIDYLSSRGLRISLGFLVTLVMIVFAWVGVRMILTV